ARRGERRCSRRRSRRAGRRREPWREALHGALAHATFAAASVDLRTGRDARAHLAPSSYTVSVATASVDPAHGTNPRRYWLLIAVACIIPAILDALQTYAQSRLGGGQQVPWGQVVFAGSEWLFLGALTPITYLMARRFPLRRNRLRRTIAGHAIGALLLCIGWA